MDPPSGLCAIACENKILAVETRPTAWNGKRAETSGNVEERGGTEIVTTWPACSRFINRAI